MLSPLVGGLNELQAKACQKVLYDGILLLGVRREKIEGYIPHTKAGLVPPINIIVDVANKSYLSRPFG